MLKVFGSSLLLEVNKIWKEYKSENKCSQANFAKKLQINQSAFSQYLRGEIPLNLSFLVKFNKETGGKLDAAISTLTLHHHEKHTLQNNSLGAMLKSPELLPCPFCGSDFTELEVLNNKHIPRKRYDKLGRTSRCININHYVQCLNCGAKGGESIPYINSSAEILTEAMVKESENSARLLWNSRAGLTK